MKKKLFILANTKKSLFGIGDYIRIMSVLNNLNFERIYWLSDKILLPIALDTKFFFKVDNIKYNFNNIKDLKKIIIYILTKIKKINE